MTLDEAAAYLGVAKITLRRWTTDGQLRCVRVGTRGDRRFRRADLDAYIRANTLPNSKTTGKGRAQRTQRSPRPG
ncbi:MAG: helix-turn-helix domain-containing protein [Phycisphaerales bacterium]|nr:helix-turn-helix domain-containing protein [Phycisphaerales bacterium]